MRSLTVDDLRLRADAKLLLDSLDDHIRPKDLPARFPRIMNEIARLWRRPVQLDRYFDELLVDKRTGRQGLSIGVALELSTLKDYHQTEVYPKKKCVWQQVYSLPAKPK